MNVQEFNKAEKAVAEKELFACCGSEKWVSLLMEHFPFASAEDLVSKATDIWYNKCLADDWRASFSHHPKIGDVSSLKKKYAGDEQSGVTSASASTIESLAKANEDYENKFGFIFIVCATGKSAEEMLRLLKDRLSNNIHQELNIAMGEQHKITIIRLKKLLGSENWNWLKPSQLTTHVLDTSVGKPGKDITIKLQSANGEAIAQGVTNSDGRIGDLLPPERTLAPGNYSMIFDTGNYFAANNINGFYPEVDIQFTVTDDSHYHVPLLINPFGFSTYRGS
jgi:5-hydroxyisourate hydrolase/2-oxo-4-hydroxy-4-carboxy-5-ureidoimidazoline decarboxylase